MAWPLNLQHRGRQDVLLDTQAHLEGREADAAPGPQFGRDLELSTHAVDSQAITLLCQAFLRHDQLTQSPRQGRDKGPLD